MNEAQINPVVHYISDDAVSAELEAVFAEIMRVTESSIVANMYRTLAHSLPAVTGTWQLFRQLFFETNLPVQIKAMILFSVSAANQCAYCSAFMEVTCRTLGVEDAALQAIVNDLDSLNPERVRTIVRFAQRCAQNPYEVSKAEYEAVRDCGISNEELVEIVSLAALGNYIDTLADALKLETDDMFAQQLVGGQLVTRRR